MIFVIARQLVEESHDLIWVCGSAYLEGLRVGAQDHAVPAEGCGLEESGAPAGRAQLL